MNKYKKIAYAVADSVKSQQIYSFLKRSSFIDIEQQESIPDIDLLLVIGGDGFMLHSLHNYVIGNGIPVYGISYGTVGFLLNKPLEETGVLLNDSLEGNLVQHINKAVPTELTLLEMEATDVNGQGYHSVAINEVSLFRKTNRVVHIKIIINNKLRMEKLVGDGIMLSTPAGSTAYNFSAGGSILPLNSNLFALTPINPFRPRRWRGALLSDDDLVELEIIDPQNRSVTIVSDYTEFHNILRVKIYKSLNKQITLLFDYDHSLDERIFNEQFLF
ncbi:MAG: NAD kinase [Candidatus Mesenet longicola]|uniref:NAD kinase n=1 Tax=Candidatus Mesenet longicola TaxID=1892558 RepID=A0A8J3MMN4_9RICK|nr:MAG: NAD kinase [Candidatus Mesenet longicola]GHM59342.1 MAG: NAD kinase [Candidatus Mesenet longicola]